MKIAGMIMAATAALSIAGTSALAQQMRTGMVTIIDRIGGTISIKDMPDGTTGANAGAAMKPISSTVMSFMVSLFCEVI